MSAETTERDPANTGWGSRLRRVGPGIMAAATGVGAGDLVATLVAGSRFGYTLFWAIVLGTVFKLGLGEAVGRWHLGSKRTMMAGWRSLGRWTMWFFGGYVVVWGFVYGATAMSATGLPLNALFPGISVRYWGMFCGVVGLALVWFGRYRALERLMTVLVGVMFVTVVGTAVLVAPDLTALAGGAVPRLPDGSLIYVLGLIGGVGGTITMAAYGYWTLAKGWRGPGWIPFMRTDNAVGYLTTGVFVVAMLIVGSELLLGQGITDDDRGLLELGGRLAAEYGQWARLPFLIGFLAVTFTSLLGVWNGVSLMFADWWRTWRTEPSTTSGGEHGNGLLRSAAYRGYVLWLTVPPMSLLFFDRPFQLTILYGVLGALFMPFLAGTLLFLLNSRRMPEAYRSGWVSNVVLSLCLVLFAVLAAHKLLGYLT
ncbi:Nramp family divalent metal transporter [Actinopolyspora mortivallis]|uniref:Nramp family divalent metal transporter n=1 Tax=Actinopolyspora mortivallis TaxID=33906 RepID=UPI00039CC0C8|nr:Nramp family divalent metal transporter [Actinopolyspora mortivallis]